MWKYVNYDYIYGFHVSHRIFVPIKVDPWTFRPPPKSHPIEIRPSKMTFDKLLRYGNLRSLLNLDLIRP